MYKSITDWRDLTDGHLYRAGDSFPHDGREIEPERIESLRSGQNQAGMALIEAFEHPIEKIPTEKADAPRGGKKRQRTRAK